MGRKYVEKWDGGYVHRQKDGRALFVIQREIGGRRYHVSTRAHSSTAAHEQLKRFESDPDGYVEQMRDRKPADVGVVLTSALVTEFQEWLRTRERPTAPEYVTHVARYLGEWTEDLNGRDLRKVTLAELKDIIRVRGVAKRHRIIVLKSFCSYLREERSLLDRRTDATLDLKVPQASPEKRRRRKAVDAERVRAVLKVLAPAYRDCLLLLSHTGWHKSELARFARQPEARIAEGRGEVLAVLQVQHKGGETTRTPVSDRKVLEAARRIRMRGGLPKDMDKTLKRACESAGVTAFTWGVMRHSVATWAIENGTSPEVVAEFLGHKDKRTTLAFYADVAVPTRGVRLPKLV
jgi:integrase